MRKQRAEQDDAQTQAIKETEERLAAVELEKAQLLKKQAEAEKLIKAEEV